jgi:alpha-L-arabinofuranosidase
MPVQYVLDNTGKTTSVILSIDEWNNFLKQHQAMQQIANLPTENDAYKVADETQQLILQRLQQSDKSELMNWEEVKNTFSFE